MITKKGNYSQPPTPKNPIPSSQRNIEFIKLEESEKPTEVYRITSAGQAVINLYYACQDILYCYGCGEKLTLRESDSHLLVEPCVCCLKEGKSEN